MADAMKNTAKAMHKMNKAVDSKQISKMMAEFERENMKTELMQDVLGDAIDDALGDEEAEEEEEKIVSQVLDEIGINFGDELPQTDGLASPTAAGPQSSPVAVSNDPAVSELEARLNNLKR